MTRLDSSPNPEAIPPMGPGLRLPPGLKCVPVACDPVDHPVVRAWGRLAPSRPRIDRVDLLRRKSKSAVYRLGFADADLHVIAKRGLSGQLHVERTVYEGVLPRLAVPALDYHGFAGGDDGFVERVGGRGFGWNRRRTMSQARSFHGRPPKNGYSAG